MATVAVPEVIGNFRIVSKIGQGGMGAVFRAMHGTLERPVALKILPAELASNAEYVARFLREARTIAQLRHDNVVQVYDAGEQNGQYYIAMELVDGCSLQKYIDETHGRITEEEGLALLLQAAKGLAAAHAKGLVHRDVKPENMLLDKDKTLRLVDFGLVMESSSTSQLTATGACLGTPMYMSPEQADGEHADARTDLYSLGVSFYRAFTGQPPFSSATVMNLLFKHKFEAPPDPRQLRPDLSPNVRNLLLHLMAKKREERPASAQAVVEMIEGLAKGKAIPPPPAYVPPVSGTDVTVLSPYAAAREAGAPSRKGALIAAAILAALLAAGLIFALARHGQDVAGAPPPPEKPATPAQPDPAAKGDDAFAGGLYEEARQHYSKALAEKPHDQELKSKLARAERARNYDEAMQAAQALEEKGDLDAAAAKYDEAAALDRGAKARERLERLRAAIAKNKGLNARQRNAELDAISGKAAAAEKAADFEAAAEHYSHAAALADGAIKSVFADKARECRRQYYQAKGMAAEELKNYAEAEKWYAKALEIKPDPLLSEKLDALQRKLKGAVPAREEVTATPMREGQAALEAGDFVKARVQFTLALTYRAANDPEIATKLKEVDGREALAKGDTFKAAGDVANALSAYTEALQKCPALTQTATARIQSLGTAPAAPMPAPTAVMAQIDDLVRAQKDTEALVQAVASLRAAPGSQELKDLKAALEGLQACADLYAELQKIVSSGLSRVRDARDIDDDERARDWRDALEKLRDRFAEQAGKPRPLFLAHNYTGVQSSLASARSDARDLASQLAASADGCDRKAEKAAEKGTSIKGPFGFSVGVGGDKKKAERYRSLSEDFRKLADQARAQGK